MVLICNYTNSQNLIFNPSFEEHYSCPNDQGQLWKAIGWKNIGYSPDLLSGCDSLYGFGVPMNIYGYQNAAIGNSYAGTFQYWENVPNLREYIETQPIQMR